MSEDLGVKVVPFPPFIHLQPPLPWLDVSQKAIMAEGYACILRRWPQAGSLGLCLATFPLDSWACVTAPVCAVIKILSLSLCLSCAIVASFHLGLLVSKAQCHAFHGLNCLQAAFKRGIQVRETRGNALQVTQTHTHTL